MIYWVLKEEGRFIIYDHKYHFSVKMALISLFSSYGIFRFQKININKSQMEKKYLLLSSNFNVKVLNILKKSGDLYMKNIGILFAYLAIIHGIKV